MVELKLRSGGHQSHNSWMSAHWKTEWLTILRATTLSLKGKYTFGLATAYTPLQMHNTSMQCCSFLPYQTRMTPFLLLLFLLTPSFFFRASPSGVSHRGRYRGCGHPPHHLCVLQAVQDENTETAGRERGGSSQREKRPHCVVRPWERQRERMRGKREEQKNHPLPLSLSI